MNYWLAEELAWLTYTERQHELDTRRLEYVFRDVQTDWAYVGRAALKLSDWLIATGESLRRRYENTTPGSPWVDNRNFAR